MIRGKDWRTFERNRWQGSLRQTLVYLLASRALIELQVAFCEYSSSIQSRKMLGATQLLPRGKDFSASSVASSYWLALWYRATSTPIGSIVEGCYLPATRIQASTTDLHTQTARANILGVSKHSAIRCGISRSKTSIRISSGRSLCVRSLTSPCSRRMTLQAMDCNDTTCHTCRW